jgi:uncharacterized protein
MATISELYIYPIKSLGGIKVNEVQITDRGFQYDRRWMLTDANNRFLTQREHASMALLQTVLVDNGIEVYQKNNADNKIVIPFVFEQKKKITVTVFDDICEAITINDEIDEWFSRYAIEQRNITAFSDGYPILMISEASLADLNGRLEEVLPINRFRPNLVIEGVAPFEEDSMKHFTINGISFYVVKPCDRCVITTINQQTIEKGKEPLKTLATYRMKNNKIYFGQNVIPGAIGKIKTGDAVNMVSRTENTIFSNI